MKTRKGISALLALALLATIAAQPGAQDAEPDSNPKPEFVTREYDFTALLADRREYSPPEPWAEVCFYGWWDDQSRESPEDSWLYAYNNKMPDFSDLAHFTGLVKELSTDNDLDSIEESQYSKTRLKISATEALHARIEAARQMLLDLMRARIHIELYRLKSVPSELILTDVPEGTLIGRRDIPHGGYTLFSDVIRKRVTWSSGQRSYGTVPETDEQFYGEQWGVAGLILHDNRIRLQAWHSSLENTGIREWTTRCGNIQLPSGKWDATPGAAIVPNGGGLVLETDSGAFLVRATTSTPIAQRVFEDSNISLLNPANATRPGDFTGRWLFKPSDGTRGWQAEPVIFPNHEPHSRGPILYPGEPAWHLGAIALVDSLEPLTGGASGIDLHSHGAMLLMNRGDLFKGVTAEFAEETKKVLAKLLSEQLEGPTHYAVAITLLRVPKSVPIPEGAAKGSPREKDIETLRNSKGVAMEFSRRVVLAANQQSDVVRASVRNYLSRLDPDSFMGGEAKYYATEVASQCDGFQARITMLADAGLDLSAVWRHDSELRKFEPDGDLQGEVFEHPYWIDASFRFSGPVGDERVVCELQPAGNEETAVLLVTCTEVK